MDVWVVSILAVIASSSLLLALFTHIVAHMTLSRASRKTGPTPAISILKPLCGLDDGLEENLRAIAVQDYPVFEVLFAAEDAEDPALDVARRVKRTHPAVPMKIVVSSSAAALNPKVANLMAMTREAKHRYLLVSDSNVRPDPGYLRAIAAETADSRVGLVSSVLSGSGETTVGALLENAHLNSFILSAVCAGNSLARHPCVIGKSMLVRRTDLESLGGWESVGDLLAEDYILGHRFKKAGLGVALSSHPVPTINADWSVRRFLHRHLRWNQMRRRIAPIAYLFEPLLYPVPWLLSLAVASAACEDDWGLSPQLTVAVTLVGVLMKASSDLALSRRLRGHGLGIASLAWMPVKDMLLLPLWLLGAFRRKVAWRGHQLRIGAGSRLERGPATAPNWNPEAPAPE